MMQLAASAHILVVVGILSCTGRGRTYRIADEEQPMLVAIPTAKSLEQFRLRSFMQIHAGTSEVPNHMAGTLRKGSKSRQELCMQCFLVTTCCF